MHPAQPPEIDAILRGLQDSATILSNLVTAIPEEALHRVRGEGFWTIAQHVAHLADVQPMGLGRLTRMLQEDPPEFVPFFPDEQTDSKPAPPPPVEQSLADFRKGRQAIVDLLTGIAPDDWARTAIHPEYQQYGVHIFARHILMHDHWHMYRIEQLWLTRDDYLTSMEG